MLAVRWVRLDEQKEGNIRITRVHVRMSADGALEVNLLKLAVRCVRLDQPYDML